MAKNICKVCGCTFDSGEILLHKNLRAIKDEVTVIGWSLCPEDQKKFNEGYLALVVVNQKSKHPTENETLKPSEADRTGMILHIKRHVAAGMFNVEIPEDIPLSFIDVEAANKIRAMLREPEDERYS